MKKITVSATVGDGWPYSEAKGKALKNVMARVALEQIQADQLDLVAIEATTGTVRKRR